jgi:nitrate/TMAO reductase-like tetraheme cytochrome c subunit
MSILNKRYRASRLGMVLLIFFGLTLSVFALTHLVFPVQAAAPQVVPAVPVAEAPSNDLCLSCHTQQGFGIDLPNGDHLVLTIDPDAFKNGVHNESGIACVACHTDISGFPHPERTAQSLRELQIQYYTTCKQCHATEFGKTLDSVHQKALAAGNTNAAICVDCHNPHTQTRITNKENGKILPEVRVTIPQICAKCHSAIYDVYKDSVHGAALLKEGNPDVPTCIDCHGVHNIQDPTTEAFRLKSPTEMCGKCHTDPAIMDKYGISTNVLNTYVADFHGTTVTLFEKASPDQQTNKPVCFDCHGVHDIQRVDDPQKGILIKQNLLVKCQRCHPTATTDSFTGAWLGHYIPNAQKYPVVYFVNLFYKIFIPTVIGSMAIFVVSDFVRRLIDRRKGNKHA